MTQTIDLGLVKGEPGFGVPKPGVSDVGKIPAVNSAGDGYELVSIKEGGTTNYDSLSNKPQINGIELVGNQTSQDLKINYILDLGDVRNGQEISITKEQKQLLLSENPPILKARIDNVSYYMERFGMQTEAAMFSGSATLNGDYKSILAVSINASVENPTVNIFVEDYGSVPLANIADAGKVPAVNAEGTGYELIEMSGGSEFSSFEILVDDEITEPAVYNRNDFDKTKDEYLVTILIPKVEETLSSQASSFLGAKATLYYVSIGSTTYRNGVVLYSKKINETKQLQLRGINLGMDSFEPSTVSSFSSFAFGEFKRDVSYGLQIPVTLPTGTRIRIEGR